MDTLEVQRKKLDIEIAAYEGMQSALESTHWGEWVVFHGGELRGTYGDFQEAANAAVTRFGRGPYLIQQVGAPREIHLPASLLYHPVYADR